MAPSLEQAIDVAPQDAGTDVGEPKCDEDEVWQAFCDLVENQEAGPSAPTAEAPPRAVIDNIIDWLDDLEQQA